METPEQQPTDDTPTPATLPSDEESDGDAREGDDQHEDTTDTDEQSDDS